MLSLSFSLYHVARTLCCHFRSRCLSVIRTRANGRFAGPVRSISLSARLLGAIAPAFSCDVAPSNGDTVARVGRRVRENETGDKTMARERERERRVRFSSLLLRSDEESASPRWPPRHYNSWHRGTVRPFTAGSCYPRQSVHSILLSIRSYVSLGTRGNYKVCVRARYRTITPTAIVDICIESRTYGDTRVYIVSSG